MGFLLSFTAILIHMDIGGATPLVAGSHDGFIIELHSVIMAWLAALFVETNATAGLQCGALVCATDSLT